jgi:hypothetical protein
MESTKTNNHKGKYSLESYKVSHLLIQKANEQLSLGLPFKLHTSQDFMQFGKFKYGRTSKEPIRCASTQVERYFPEDPSEICNECEVVMGLLLGMGSLT